VAGKLAVQSMQSQSLALSVVAFALCPSYDSTETGSLNASTSGLVGEFQFSCLASVPASLSMFLVVVMQLPAVVMILRQPHVHDKSPGTTPVLAQGLFLKSAAYAAVTLFMFGYHVHEKAILVALIPLTVLLRPSCVDGVVGPGFESVRERERWHAVYLQVAAGGVTALLPLLMNVEELALKGDVNAKSLSYHSVCMA
jgi:alpha-1,3-glucosyltransferase